MSKQTRLISFLGIGDYDSIRYQLEGIGEAAETPYVAVALAELYAADFVDILATLQSRKKHEDGLRQAFESKPDLRLQCHEYQAGRSDDGRWGQFKILADLFKESAGNEENVVLDITHGFRAQPFFAGAVLNVLLAAEIRPRSLQVVYGEFRKGEDCSLVWDLTQFVDLTEWSQALAVFLRTGHAAQVTELGRRMQKSLAGRRQAGELKSFSGFGSLVKAIGDFADDLATIRVAHLITGYEQDDSKKHKARGSAERLQSAIDQCRNEVAKNLPPLALVLDRIQDMVKPLVADKLASDSGQQALHALANHYLSLERYPEAAVIVRESQINRFAKNNHLAVEVNASDFSDHQRELADEQFYKEDEGLAREIANIRNDIEHAGFRKQPLSASKLKVRMKSLAENYAPLCPNNSEAPATRLAGKKPAPRTWVVTRHPGAVQWLAAKGIEATDTFSHLDPEITRCGDTVVGTIPLHLAAELCARDVRILFLSLDLPETLRGRELTRTQLEQCNARLEEFVVWCKPAPVISKGAIVR